MVCEHEYGTMVQSKPGPIDQRLAKGRAKVEKERTARFSKQKREKNQEKKAKRCFVFVSVNS